MLLLPLDGECHRMTRERCVLLLLVEWAHPEGQSHGAKVRTDHTRQPSGRAWAPVSGALRSQQHTWPRDGGSGVAPWVLQDSGDRMSQFMGKLVGHLSPQEGASGPKLGTKILLNKIQTSSNMSSPGPKENVVWCPEFSNVWKIEPDLGHAL